MLVACLTPASMSVFSASKTSCRNCMRMLGTFVRLMSFPAAPESQYVSETQCLLSSCGKSEFKT